MLDGANGAQSAFQLGGGESKDLLLFFNELPTHHTSSYWHLALLEIGIAECLSFLAKSTFPVRISGRNDLETGATEALDTLFSQPSIARESRQFEAVRVF